MAVNLTDEEIRQIILRKRKKERARKIKRNRLIIASFLALFLCITGYSIYTGSGIFYFLQNRGVIFLDPGHGGDDPGASALGRNEKDDTLALTLQVQKYLQRKRFKVYVSRNTDVDVDRPKRAEMANEVDAKLLVSIHRNQSDGSGHGVEAWIHSGGNPSAALLAKNILKELESQGFTYRKVETGTLPDPSDNYSENRYSNMPSCIVEVGFLSDEGDNTLFDDNLKGNAKAIADGIESTYESLYEKKSE